MHTHGAFWSWRTPMFLTPGSTPVAPGAVVCLSFRRGRSSTREVRFSACWTSRCSSPTPTDSRGSWTTRRGTTRLRYTRAEGATGEGHARPSYLTLLTRDRMPHLFIFTSDMLALCLTSEHDCANSLWGETLCGNAVHGRLDEMSPAPLARPPPHSQTPRSQNSPPPMDTSMTGGRQGGQGRIDEQGRIDDITNTARDFALQLP